MNTETSKPREYCSLYKFLEHDWTVTILTRFEYGVIFDLYDQIGISHYNGNGQGTYDPPRHKTRLLAYTRELGNDSICVMTDVLWDAVNGYFLGDQRFQDEARQQVMASLRAGNQEKVSAPSTLAPAVTYARARTAPAAVQ